MKRALRPLLALLPVAILVGSCVGTDSPTGVDGREVQLNIPINPALIPTPADGSAAPINRIRVRAARASDNVVVGEVVLDVSPTAEEWEIVLDATVTGEMEVNVYVYLLHVEGEVETIEFSGLVGPIALVAGETVEATDIPIIRGPIRNFFTTGVTITTVPATLIEGATAALEADATTSGDSIPVVFWTVLDSAFLSSVDADVTGLTPGVGRIIASAGIFADTASIVVTPAPAAVLVSPDTASVIGVGAQASFTAAVVDSRGDTIAGEGVVWSAGTPQIVGSLGGGSFEALGVGSGLVQAAAASDPGVVGSAVMIVAAAPADVVIAKTGNVSVAQEADTVGFEIVVTNQSQDALFGIAVADSVPTGLTVESTSPQGTFDAGTGTWTWALDTIAVGATDTITVRASVDVGVGDATLTNVALVSPPAGFADPNPLDNRAEAAVTVTSDAPDVEVLIEANDSTPADGETIQVTVSVSNLDVGGAVPVSNVVVGTARSGELSVVGSAPSQGSYDDQSDTWTVGDIAIDASATLTLDVAVASGSVGLTLTETAFVASLDQSQANLANDTASVQMVVQTRDIDVAVLKTVDEPQPLADSTVVFTVSLVNNGTGEATGLSVFDTLAGVFLNPAHVVSAGSLVDDTLWTVASLAEGDTATWTTTATVATDAAGTSTSNTAILRSVAQNDTTPANDTAVVAMNFPISAVPVVQITSPADSAVYDPGDLATFTGTANDAEEGDLSAEIEWASDLDGFLATGRSFETTQLTTGVHNISASVTDQDGGTGADTITVTIALITTPTTLNVPFGGSASLPITLSEPAQAGGLTLSVTSADPSVTAPTTTTVFIAGGALAGNATMQGLQPGTVDVTVSHPQFGVSTTSVSVTAEIDILTTFLTVPQTFPQDITLQLESAGVQIAAPAGGLDVTLTSIDPACTSAPSTVTIPAGLVQTTATISYGGSAQLSCTAYVRASAPSITPDSVSVTVTPPPSFTLSDLTVGAGLQYGTFWASLGTAAHGGVTVRVESEDPSTMLVSPDASTPGTAFIDAVVPDGQNRAFYYVQGVEGATGASSLVASATGFATDSALITVVQPAIDIAALNTTSLTTFSPDDPFYIRTGVANAQNTGLSISQAVRAGGQTVTGTITSSVTSVGDLITLPDSASPVTVTVDPGRFNSATSVAQGGVAFEPIGAGNTTVSATAPGFIQTANAVRDVAVSAPDIFMSGLTVGAGLQYGTFWATLEASGHGGVTVRIESEDPSVMLVAPDANTPGTAFIDVAVPDGQTRATYYAQGVEGQTGVVPLTASAPGFNSVSADVTVVQPGYDMVGVNTTTTTLTNDDPFYVRVGVPNSQATGLSINQAIRAGGQSLTATITSSVTSVGDLITLPDSASPVTVTIDPGQFNSPTSVATGGVALEPIGPGTTDVVTTIDGLVQTANAMRTVTVSSPATSVNGTTVGSGLQYGTFSATLGATGHGGVTVRIESEDPAVLLVSPDAATEGTPFIDVVVPDGQSRANYYVHGVEGQTGVVPLLVSAPGFTSSSADINVVQAGYDIGGLTLSQTTFSPNDLFQVRVGVPNGSATALSALQAVRIGGTTLTPTITTNQTGVGILVTNQGSGASVTADIVPGSASTPSSLALGGVEFDPLGSGVATVSASIAGLVATDVASRDVTVSAPGISVPATTVGSGLMYGNFNATLGATQHGGVTVTITSSNPDVLLVSPDNQTEGTASIQVFVANGLNRANYWVHGLEGQAGTVTLTVTANGFTDGTAAIGVVQPGLDFVSLGSSYSVDATDDAFYVRLGVPTSNQTDISVQQAIRIGGNAVTATITSDNTAVAQMVTQSASGGTIQLQILPGEASTPTSVGLGGVAIDPVAVGSAFFEATIPGFVTTNDGTRTVTINP